MLSSSNASSVFSVNVSPTHATALRLKPCGVIGKIDATSIWQVSATSSSMSCALGNAPSLSSPSGVLGDKSRKRMIASRSVTGRVNTSCSSRSCEMRSK